LGTVLKKDKTPVSLILVVNSQMFVHIIFCLKVSLTRKNQVLHGVSAPLIVVQVHEPHFGIECLTVGIAFVNQQSHSGQV
jgi:hypothetical protein